MVKVVLMLYFDLVEYNGSVKFLIGKFVLFFQVGKKLSELIRDSGNQAPGSEQGRWQAELAQVAIELIGVSITIYAFNSMMFNLKG